ncbi:hypothetical protein TNCV_4247231 [Trichonephila clavipes]|nr:hypothetical protein TNCV_4247231 [Trichonephila clavipes]
MSRLTAVPLVWSGSYERGVPAQVSSSHLALLKITTPNVLVFITTPDLVQSLKLSFIGYGQSSSFSRMRH